MTQDDADLADLAGQFYDDPLGFVLAAWEWDSDPSLQMVELPAPWSMVYDSKFGPDKWACEVLDEIGEHVRLHPFNGKDAVAPVREAIASGHGIGKSALVAWIVQWIMATRPFCRGTITANTAEQLASKTWAEVSKWNTKSLWGHWFEVSTGKGNMKMHHRAYPDAWGCHAQTATEERSEAFAGQHAANSTSFYIFDEASAIPDAIWEVAEGGLTDGAPMFFAFGNPTRNTGKFKDCFGSQAHRWNTRQIDSRNVSITNKKALEDMVSDYGEDSDIVKVRVRGMFPSASSYQFISTDDVDAATHRHLRKEEYEWAPKILTLDPAWTGDDELVFGLRQGLRFDVLRAIPKNDNDVQVANLLAQLEDEHKADAVFVDAGYGTGIVSVGQSLNRDWKLVWFGAASPDPGYLNMRAWIWGQAKKWLKEGGAIDEADKQLYRDLIGPETVPRVDGKIQLESKEDMKRRGQPSPNRADALAISFAFPVVAKKLAHIDQPKARTRDYDPHELME